MDKRECGPPDARLLIVNCDDFGMHDGINAAVIDAIEHGIATSCSLMVPCPAAPDAMRLDTSNLVRYNTKTRNPGMKSVLPQINFTERVCHGLELDGRTQR